MRRSIILLFVVAVASGFAGYFSAVIFAPRPLIPASSPLTFVSQTSAPSAPALDSQQQMLQNELRTHIQMEQEAYQFIADGKTQPAMNKILFNLWWDTDYYERVYGVPSGADRFPDIFSKAKELVAKIPIEVRTNAITY